MRLFVTVGNAREPFDRLLRLVDEAIAVSNLPVEGVCQHGTSSVRPRALATRPLLGRDEFEREMDRADAVVCHAGVGAVSAAIRRGHVPLVLPRRRALGEHVNDHQLELFDALHAQGRIAPITDAPSLADALARARRSDAGGRLAPRDPARIAPVARALELGAPRAKNPRLGRLFLLAVAALGPRLERLRVPR